MMKGRRRYSRPMRLLRNALLTAVLAAAVWVCLGCPSATARGAYRRLEHAYLVGPGEILAEIPLEGTEERLYAARDQGYLLLASVWREGLLRWQPGGMAIHSVDDGLAAFPGVWADGPEGRLYVLVLAPQGTDRVEGSIAYDGFTAEFSGQENENGLFMVLAQFDVEDPRFWVIQSKLSRVGQVRRPYKSNPTEWIQISLRAYDAHGRLLQQRTQKTY